MTLRPVRRPADRGVRTADEHAGAVAQGGGASRVGAEKIPLDHIAAGRPYEDPRVAEAVDHQPAHGDAGDRKRQAVRTLPRRIHRVQ